VYLLLLGNPILQICWM